jgi:hypothetical protein
VKPRRPPPKRPKHVRRRPAVRETSMEAVIERENPKRTRTGAKAHKLSGDKSTGVKKVPHTDKLTAITFWYQ